MAVPRYLQPVIEALKELGCKIETEQNKHVKIYVTAEKGQFVWTVASSPGDRRSNLNALAILKRKLRECGVEPTGLAMRGAGDTNDGFTSLFLLIKACETAIETDGGD